MKTKKLIITCILAGIYMSSFHLNAQTPAPQEYMPSIVPVSPNAASLGVFGSIPVGHYTGVPHINIPLYEIDLDGKTIPISLSYHASGIKVAQESSWVGLGWTLNAGGCITREMRGWDDFCSSGGYPIGYYKNNEFPNNTNYNEITGQISCTVGNKIHLGQRDVNPDLFYYNFANHTGSMFVNRSQYPSREPKASFRKVEEYLDATVDLNRETTPWFIVDGEGYKYYFGGSPSSTEVHTPYSSSTTYADGNRISPEYPLNEIEDDPWAGNHVDKQKVIMTWYLDSIVSPLGRKIEFQYVTDIIITPIRKDEKRSINVFPPWTNDEGTPEMPGSYIHYSFSYSMIEQKVLKKIISPSGTIEFQTSDRKDLLPHEQYLFPDRQAQKLQEITIYNNSQNPIKSMQFHYSYMGDTVSYKTCRLMLEGINEKSGNQSNYFHQFEYNRGELPPKYSKSIDHWGYYNKGVNNGGWGMFNYFSPAAPNEGTLVPTRIVYREPQGPSFSLSSLFSFNETSNYARPTIIYGADRNPNAETMQYGILTGIQYPTGGKSQFEYEPHTFYPFESGIEKTQLCSIDSVKINVLDPNTGGGIIKHIELEENAIVYLDLSVLHQIPNPSNNNTANRAYVVFHKDDDPGGPSLFTYEECTYHTHPNDYYYDYINPFPVLEVGKTTATAILQTDLEKGTYRVYIVVNPDCVSEPNWLTAKIGTIDKKKISFGAGLRIKRIKNTDPSNNILTSKMFNYIGEGILMFRPVYFEMITYAFKGNFGFTEYGAEYARGTSNSIRSISDPSCSQFSEIQVGYGQVDEIDGTGNGKIRRIFYNNAPIDMEAFNVISSKNGLLDKILFYDSDGQIVKQQVNSYTLQSKDIIPGFLPIPTGVPLGTTDLCLGDWSQWLLLRNYEIASDWWKLNSETVTEHTGNGTMTTTTNYVYNTQNYLPKEITTTGSQNESIKQIIRYPDEYSSYTGMVSKHLVNLPVENLSLVNNSVVKAVKTDYKDTLNTYLPKMIWNLNAPTPLSTSNYAQHYASEVTFDKYDSKGKVLQLSTRNGDKIVYLWGYNHQYPIAEIKNATYNQIESILTKSYIDYVASNNSPEITPINNLRNNPALKDAMITTYRYKPLVGVTTVTDPSGKTVTYEYDVFGRLMRIKDLNGKTLEENEYHFKN